MKKICIENE
jgi:hypothetical protein